MFIKTGDLNTPRIVSPEDLTEEQKKQIDKKIKESDKKPKEKKN